MRRSLPLALLLLATASGWAAAPPASLPAALVARLDSVLDSSALERGFSGALVVALGQRPTAAVQAGSFGLAPYDNSQRPELYARHANRVFTPASGLKLLTAAAGLEALGPGHQFTTRVIIPTPPVDGAVPAIYLVGGGDPALDYARLRELAVAVRAAGVTAVREGVYGDCSRYQDRLGNGWTVDDLPWYYAAEVSALSLGRNHVDVFVGPGSAPGQPARVWCEPSNRYVNFDNQVVTFAAGRPSAVTFDRPLGENVFRLTGRIAMGQRPVTEGLTIANVELYAATVFRDLLRQDGVTVGEQVGVALAPRSGQQLAAIQSPPLAELIQRVLKRSDNLYAEMLLRELGTTGGGDGSASAGLRAVRAFLTSQQVDTGGLRLEDGSGLSRYNLVTPRAVVGVLRAMAQSRYREPWFAALSIAGVDGTLTNRMRGTAAARNVRAKTGYISNNTSLSGYITTRSGDLLAVATLFNHFTAPTSEARAAHDRFFVTLAEWSRGDG